MSRPVGRGPRGRWRRGRRSSRPAWRPPGCLRASPPPLGPRLACDEARRSCAEAELSSGGASGSSLLAGLDRGGQPDEDLIRSCHPVDDVQPSGLAVELDQRSRLFLVQVETLVDRVRCVVVTLGHVATADVADPRLALPAAGDIVRAAVTADPARGEALE